MDQVPKRFDINDYASAFRKRKWLIVGVSLCALFIGFGLTRVAEPMYRAESVVLVKSESRPMFMMNGQPARLHDPVALETETLRAQTMSLAQAAADKYVMLASTAEPADQIAPRLRQALSARAQEPNIIHLQATANDPEATAVIAVATARTDRAATKIKAGSGAAVADAVAVVVAVAAAGRIATAIAIVTGAAGVRAAVATTGRSIARDQHRHMTAALRFSNRAPRLVQRGPGGLRGTARRPRPAPRSGIDGRPCRPHRQPFPSSDRTCSCVADRWRSVPRRGAPG